MSPLRKALQASVGILWIAAIVIWPAGQLDAAIPKITAITLREAPPGLVLAITASGPVRYQLRNFQPGWIVVDIQGAELGMQREGLPPARDPVQKIRVGQFTPNVVRVVAELSQAVQARTAISPQRTTILVSIPTSTARPALDRPAEAIPDQSSTADYVLGPEDVLEIVVWGHNDLSHTVTVRPDGRITLPLIGTVSVAGVSVKQLMRSLTQAYVPHVAKANVTVIVKEFGKLRIAVLGAVAHTGTFLLPRGARILDALSEAGGIVEDAAPEEAQLLSPGDPPRTVDLRRLFSGSPAANLSLRSGETIVVPGRIRISVLGQVAHPGTYLLPPHSRILDAVAAAGGVGEAAALKEAQLLRPGESPRVVDLQAASAGVSDAGLFLRGGDTLIVPEDVVNVISVLGEVSHPGQFRLKGETHVLDALVEAGGLTDKAWITQATLLRASHDNERLNLDELLLKQDMSRNVVLQPRDMIFVPGDASNKVYVLGDVTSPGVYPLKGEVTVLQSLAMAGGPVQRGVGTARSIHIIRRSIPPGSVEASVNSAKSEPLPNGKGVHISMDLTALMRGDLTKNEVFLQAGDIVVVPESHASGLSSLLTIIGTLLGVLRP